MATDENSERGSALRQAVRLAALAAAAALSLLLLLRFIGDREEKAGPPLREPATAERASAAPTASLPPDHGDACFGVDAAVALGLLGSRGGRADLEEDGRACAYRSAQGVRIAAIEIRSPGDAEALIREFDADAVIEETPLRGAEAAFIAGWEGGALAGRIVARTPDRLVIYTFEGPSRAEALFFMSVGEQALTSPLP